MSRLLRARIAVKAGLKLAIGAAMLPFLPLRPRRPHVRVLYYHRVNDVPGDALGPVSREVSVRSGMFDRQLAYLGQRGYTVLSAAAFEAILRSDAPVPPRAVLLTFDDGYADNCTHALPLLKRHACPALVFITTDLMGGNGFPWDPGGRPDASRPLSWDQVREMAGAGIAFGSHSRSHPRLDLIGSDALDDELAGSKARIEHETGLRVAFFAYPGGDFSPAVSGATQRAGYAAAFTTVPGVVGIESDRYELRRTEVSASDPLPVFALKLAGALDVVAFKESGVFRRARDRMNRWLLARLARGTGA